MSYRLGSDLSDKIAAIAPIVGTSGGTWFVPEPVDSKLPYICSKPEYPMPVIAFNGMLDEQVPYEGGWVHAFESRIIDVWMYSLSINESIDLWVEYNNCNPNPQIYQTESGRTIFRNYTGGDGNSEVILVTYVDGGHQVFISPEFEVSSTDLMWEFFERHPKQNTVR
jgi:polyhydroxybutyrate depolymerase